jgi:hypothetical protein
VSEVGGQKSGRIFVFLKTLISFELLCKKFNQSFYSNHHRFEEIEKQNLKKYARSLGIFGDLLIFLVA